MISVKVIFFIFCSCLYLVPGSQTAGEGTQDGTAAGSSAGKEEQQHPTVLQSLYRDHIFIRNVLLFLTTESSPIFVSGSAGAGGGEGPSGVSAVLSQPAG